MTLPHSVEICYTLPMTRTIATWNINSVRLRAGLLPELVEKNSIDILCLQETKVEDRLFPEEDIRNAGFEHLLYYGEKGYNGVAILSREPLERLESQHFAEKPHCRHLGARLTDGTEVHNLYIPAGGDIPDPQENPSFAYKLAYLDELTNWSRTTLSADRPAIITGDFNIAPLEHDVWSHKQLLKVVSHTPIEVEKLNRLQHTLGWIDSTRQFVPANEKCYSWWSYRARDWRKANRGRRLDHLWVTPAMASQLKDSYIFSEARGWERPSDHAPVITTLESNAG